MIASDFGQINHIISFSETFVATLPAASVKIVAALASRGGRTVAAPRHKPAFILAHTRYIIYNLPDGYWITSDEVILLQRSVHGHRQADRQ